MASTSDLINIRRNYRANGRDAGEGLPGRERCRHSSYMSEEKPTQIAPFPTEDKRSLAYHTARTTLDAAASVVPGAGYAVGELVKHFIGEPLEKRREQWFTSLGMVVLELQNRFDGFEPSSLAENEEFISVIYETTHLAMKTHNEDRRQALLNAAANVAVGFKLEDAVRGYFLQNIEKYSGMHFRVLDLALKSDSDVSSFIEKEKKISKEVYLVRKLAEEYGRDTIDLIFNNLQIDGLIDGNNFRGPYSAEKDCLTDVGRSFLSFVRNPLA